MARRHGTLETVARVKRRRRIILFGAGGRLGRAIAEAAAPVGRPVVTVAWSEAARWAASDQRRILARFAAAGGEADIVFAGGITDPGAAEADLMRGNLGLPASVIEACADDPRYRYLTFGSALETFAGLSAGNRYLASKAALWRHLETLMAEPRLAGRIAHLRLHTLYGGTPAPHSFLGQIHESLRARRIFRMSEGRQLREYCHVADAARSVLALLSRDWRGEAVLHLSTGTPVALREVAIAVFRAFGREELLRLAALPTPGGENMDLRLPRSPAWLLGRPRAPIPGIVEWLSDLLGEPHGG